MEQSRKFKIAEIKKTSLLALDIMTKAKRNFYYSAYSTEIQTTENYRTLADIDLAYVGSVIAFREIYSSEQMQWIPVDCSVSEALLSFPLPPIEISRPSSFLQKLIQKPRAYSIQLFQKNMHISATEFVQGGLAIGAIRGQPECNWIVEMSAQQPFFFIKYNFADLVLDVDQRSHLVILWRKKKNNFSNQLWQFKEGGILVSKATLLELSIDEQYQLFVSKTGSCWSFET